MWGTPDPRQQPLRTETHWPPSAQEHPRRLPSPPTPLRVVPKAQTQPFQAACPAFSEAGTSVGGEECGGCHVNPLPAHQRSGCCSLPPPLSKASRRRRSTRSPCLRAGHVSRQAVFKSDSAGLEWDVGFSTFVLLRSSCSSELCGSFWLHTVPGSFTDLSLRFPAVPLCCFCSFLSFSH